MQQIKIRDILEQEVPLNFYLRQEFVDNIVIRRESGGLTGELGYIEKGTGQHQSNTVYDWNYLARTLQAGDYKDPLKIICTPKEGAGVFQLEGEWYSIRRLTPLEYWRLQGFKDEDYEKSAELLCKARLYERAGRGICVPMLESIFKSFIDFDSVGTLRTFEAFSGVGSQRMALRNLGVKYEHIGIMEVDKSAILSYDAIHNFDKKDFSGGLTKSQMVEEMTTLNVAYNFSTYENEMPVTYEGVRDLYNAVKRTNNYGDITRVDTKDLPDFDFFTYSFPCKNISIAGNQLGMEKGSGTQSSLVWECERIIRDKKPRYLMMENVKNICGRNHLGFFESWIKLVSDLGYESHWDVYNAKDYGVPQNRERVIMMSEYKGDNRVKKLPVSAELW